MIKLFNEQECKNAKSRDKLPLACEYCKKTFYSTKHEILRTDRTNVASFCSPICRAFSKQKRIKFNCKQCNKYVERSVSQTSKSKFLFCSQSCGARYHNTHKTNGIRISKLEIWLQTKLIELYPNLEFHFNRKDAINSELDIYIPSLKLAFELNGIFHYEPIYGPEKLQQIQNNDNRKFQACLEKQIELCIIDTSSITYLKLEKTNKILNIVQNIINSRLVISKD